MMTVQQLVDLEEIKQLKYRYIRACDTHQMDLLDTCFADDAHIWLESGKYTRTGRKDIMKWYEDLLTPAPSFISTHMVGHPEITFTGETTARGMWRVEDIVHFTEANPVVTGFETAGGEVLQGAANYYDEYVKLGNEWKFKSTGYVRIFKQLADTKGVAGFKLMVDPDLGIKK